jgi:hypothetical protein
MILRRGRQDRVTLAAKTSAAFSLGEQHAHFRLAAGGEKSQSVERTGQGAPLDEFAAPWQNQPDNCKRGSSNVRT